MEAITRMVRRTSPHPGNETGRGGAGGRGRCRGWRPGSAQACLEGVAPSRTAPAGDQSSGPRSSLQLSWSGARRSIETRTSTDRGDRMFQGRVKIALSVTAMTAVILVSAALYSSWVGQHAQAASKPTTTQPFSNFVPEIAPSNPLVVYRSEEHTSE